MIASERAEFGRLVCLRHARLYIVCYWWYDGQDLLQLADVGIAKEEIIENVRDQKYREGADYYLMQE